MAYLNAKEDKFTTVMNTYNHGLLPDEPLFIGGGDHYGIPGYEIVTAGLAVCTVMSVNLYAIRKEWLLHDIKVYLSHIKEKEEHDNSLNIFKKEIELTEVLAETQKARLLEITTKCPIQKKLRSSSIIKTVQK